MSIFNKKAAVLGAALIGAVAVNTAQAAPSLVQFDPTGSGTWPATGTTGIMEFDWQSSGDVTIPDLLPGAGSFSSGLGGFTTSFSTWAATALPGDSVTFDLHAHARLNDMLNGDLGQGPLGSSILDPSISTDGTATGCANGAGCVEITGAISGTESALLVAPGVFIFTGITGSYAFFVDSTPDSDVATGTGFIDGVSMLSGSVVGTGGSFIAGTGGSIFLTNTVDAYNSNYIEADPTAGAPLVGTTFDSLMSLVSLAPAPNDNGHEAAASDAGDIVGLAGYVVQAGDLSIKGDANNEFAIPAPGTMLLLGAGLLGLGATAKRRKKAAA